MGGADAAASAQRAHSDQTAAVYEPPGARWFAAAGAADRSPAAGAPPRPTATIVNEQPNRGPHRLNEALTPQARVWHLALELVKLTKASPIGDAELRDHGSRAAKSVALNIAEGAALDGAAQRRHFGIARASVVEAVAAYEIAAAIGERVPLIQVLELGCAVAGMLTKLIR